MGPCPDLVKAWIGEHYSETSAQEAQLGCPEVLATPPMGGLPGYGGKQPPTTPPHMPGPMGCTDLDGGHQAPSPPTLTQGSGLLEHCPGRRPGVER